MRRHDSPGTCEPRRADDRRRVALIRFEDAAFRSDKDSGMQPILLTVAPVHRAGRMARMRSAA
ncbi:hypothetical protein AB870_06015 [Pandoraea faecigallinarum]|uniref:Uncharacterized protein n=1 Tax=Pandoraea faecigallinarum TaxID=656179 RepID=A0A0H3WQB7_9BURK|nr:hypothetical protein AB870_06015 [Pandoraea faecigallinarum]